MHSLIRSSVSIPSRSLAGHSMNITPANVDLSGTKKAELYDLWLNSMLSAVGPSMVTGVISSSSHQINSERLAEKLMKLSVSEVPREIAGERI